MTEKKLDEILFILKGIDAKILSMLKPESQETVVKEITNAVKEEISMDLVGVLIMKETEKAFLIVKHGFQAWIAKSHLEDPSGYDLGNTYDLTVKDKSKWVLNKLEWKPFDVVKN